MSRLLCRLGATRQYSSLHHLNVQCASCSLKWNENVIMMKLLITKFLWRIKLSMIFTQGILTPHTTCTSNSLQETQRRTRAIRESQSVTGNSAPWKPKRMASASIYRSRSYRLFGGQRLATRMRRVSLGRVFPRHIESSPGIQGSWYPIAPGDNSTRRLLLCRIVLCVGSWQSGVRDNEFPSNNPWRNDSHI